MAVRGPYQITLTTTPQPIDIVAQDNTSGSRYAWICYDSDWYWGGDDMTAANGANPGALVKADRPVGDTASGTDEYFGCVAAGTATLYIFPAGV